MEWWEVAVGILAGLFAVYVVLLLGLWAYARTHPETVGMRDALRLLPDVLRVLKRLAADPTVSRGARIKLFLLLGYLVLPIDLVPDFLPLIGYADDVIIMALVLRSVIRSAGPDSLRRHWPGTPAGLAVIERLVGMPTPTSGNSREGDTDAS
ncbi:YkvA family protein [Arthrobacter sp. MMS24-S77]